MLLETEECVHERWRASPPGRPAAATIRKVRCAAAPRCLHPPPWDAPAPPAAAASARRCAPVLARPYAAGLCASGDRLRVLRACLGHLYPNPNPTVRLRGCTQVWGEHAEVTADLVLSHFLFSLPLDAPPSFATQLVALRWLMRFELTTSVAAPAGGWLAGGGRAPEKISWALPILVRPPSGA